MDMRQTTGVIALRVLREPFEARTWRELLYSLISAPLGVLGFGVVFGTMYAAAASVAVVVLPVFMLCLTLVRVMARVDRAAARALLGLDVSAPVRPERRPGLFGLLHHHIADPGVWRAVGYLVLRLPLGVLEFVLGFAWWAYALVFIANPVLWHLEPATRDRWGREHRGIGINDFYFDTWLLALVVTVIGLLMLFASPWLRRGVLWLDRWLLVRLLGPPSDSSQRIRELEQTRAHVINEAALTLRRIERDLHDGAQARLVALGMRLSRAQSRLRGGEVEQAQLLLDQSRTDAQEIVRELRELVRGIHPPALDAGLSPALATLGAKCALPTAVTVELPVRPPVAVETVLYFTAAELLTNAAKHSHASAVELDLRQTPGAVLLTVRDNGQGGASLAGTGSGLRGLVERLRTLDGELSVASPPGGPTTITVRVPDQEPGA
jgi:signal transduction histidine kinase